MIEDKVVEDLYDLQGDVAAIKERLTTHDVRFDNGRKAMDNMRQDIEALKPKAPDWVKLLLAGLSVIGVLMGAQLWLTDRFNARPTRLEVEKMTAPIKEAQKETAKEISGIERSQSVQASSIKNIENIQKDQGQKIDTILERLPARRSHR